MKTIQFIVPGAAQAQMRPRATTIGGSVRMYDHAKSKTYKQYVQQVAKPYLPLEVTTEPLIMTVTVYRQVLKSFSKKKTQQALDGVLYPISKPDVDNLAKTFMDSLNGLAYKDDSQVIKLIAEKKYAAEAYVSIEIKGVE